MRLIVLSLLVAVALPTAIASAQTPPIVVIGPPPASAGPPPQVVPAVPPGYEIEGDLGGMHFRARITTPGQPPPPVVVAPPAPPPPVPPRVIMVQQAPQPIAYAVPTYAPPSYPEPMTPQRAPRPRLDSGMDFGGRLALELVGAGVGFGIATGIAYLANDQPRDGGFTPTILMATAGLVPTGISIFGGAIAGGRGRFGGAMLGELIGGGIAATIVFGGGIEFHEPWEMIAVIAGPAILGAIIGFEAQHGLRTARLERDVDRDGVQLSGVSVAPTAQGNGALLGLSGTF